MTDSNTHENDERTVRCPVEGCDAEVLARGIHLHIRQTDGDGHGPSGEVPDDVSLDDLDTVGAASVEMDYPEERETEQVARLCPFCSQTFAGKEGLLIHLGQVAGRKNHPRNPTERYDPGDFPRVVIDDQDNVVEVKEQWNKEGLDLPTGIRIPVRRIYRYIAELLADGKPEEAQRAREYLLGPGPDDGDVRQQIMASFEEDDTHTE